MTQANFEAAKQYALDRLDHDLPSGLSYHSPSHTRDDVVGAAARLAEIEGVTGEALMLLLTAAFYHDIGYVEKRAGHEAVGMRIAAEVLPGFGFSPEQIQAICAMIQATVLPQEPHTLLEQILADADLDVLGRHDFWDQNQRLRAELAAQGRSFSDEAWYEGQMALMQTHSYFTPSARMLRNAAKKRHMAKLAALLDEPRSGPGQVPEPKLATTEKIAILRAVGIFAGTSDHILADVADLLQLCAAGAGTTIFLKGDQGDCLYVIAEGRVRVHDGDMTLNHLGPAEVFGEMALLDAAPRAASVTATEPTILMRLEQPRFYELMGSHPEVARGVIRVLSQRLRGRLRDMAEDFLYMQQMARLTASAAALETGKYDPRSLDEVAERSDELGQLARVFRRMADEVVAREQRLKQEVEQLRIEIDVVKKARDVAQIEETEFFVDLQKKAKMLRRQSGR
jgi:uncharacterized protein